MIGRVFGLAGGDIVVLDEGFVMPTGWMVDGLHLDQFYHETRRWMKAPDPDSPDERWEVFVWKEDRSVCLRVPIEKRRHGGFDLKNFKDLLAAALSFHEENVTVLTAAAKL